MKLFGTQKVGKERERKEKINTSKFEEENNESMERFLFLFFSKREREA